MSISRLLRSSIVPKDIEIARGDLARILHEASAGDAEYIFGNSIKTLSQDEQGVDVAFERLPPRRFDLVIGADGLHSIVRRLAFGADSEFVRHAGLYAATVSLPASDDAGREMFMLNTPGKLAALHPARVRRSHISFSGIRKFPSSIIRISSVTNAFLTKHSPASAGEYPSFSRPRAPRVICILIPLPAWA